MAMPLLRQCTGAILLAGLVWAGAAEAAPSFDCATAALPIEQALCSNAELGDLEGEMTRLFEQRLATASSGKADRLRRDMGRWLARLTKDCDVPRSGEFPAAEVERVSPCLARKYRDQIAALRPSGDEPSETAEAAAPPDPAPQGAVNLEPAAGPEIAAAPSPAAGPEIAAAPAPALPDDDGGSDYAWRAEAYGQGIVALIARIDGADGYATASVYCDSQYPERVPVFLYRLGKPVPAPAEVERLNAAMQGAALLVDGRTVQTVARSDLGTRFSGLQLLPDGSLSYMVLIDPPVLEAILHGQQLKAVLELPDGEGGVYAAETFPLRNSRKAIESAMQNCVTLGGASPPA